MGSSLNLVWLSQVLSMYFYVVSYFISFTTYNLYLFWNMQEDPEYVFRFPEPDPVSPPILGFNDVDFNYPKGPTLFRDLNFGLDMESRLAIVGPNGMPPLHLHVHVQSCLGENMWF